MADNTTLNAGSGGDVIATDDLGGAPAVKVQRVKVMLGADGVNNGDVSATNPIPIDFRAQTGGNVGVAIASILMNSAGANWTSATAINTTFLVGSGFSASTLISLQVSGTITAGAVTFEGKDSSGNWFPIQVRRLDSYVTDSTFTLATGQIQAWQVDSSSYSDIRVRLSTVITGAGTANFSGTVSIAPTTGGLTVGQASASALNATVAQGAAAALSACWPVKVTDGTNSMPAMDVAGRAGFVKVTDGTNTMPTGDAAARALFYKVTDGTNTATVKAASTAAVAADPALVVAVSPNNTVGTKELRSSTGTQTNVASSATNVNLLASNANRLGAIIFNDSTSVLFVKLGSTASATSFAYRMPSNSTLEIPYGYTGAIDGIWVSANGNARITELT